jgi:cobaltochelatase CobT
MDRATIEANGEHFLKNHLIHAIEWCEKHANLDLWGCGIGEELRPYFANRLSWDAEGDLAAKCLMNWAKELKNTKL